MESFEKHTPDPSPKEQQQVESGTAGVDDTLEKDYKSRDIESFIKEMVYEGEARHTFKAINQEFQRVHHSLNEVLDERDLVINEVTALCDQLSSNRYSKEELEKEFDPRIEKLAKSLAQKSQKIGELNTRYELLRAYKSGDESLN